MSICEIESKIVSKGITPLPAASDQIHSLKKDLCFDVLPSSYYEFLMRMGNGTKNGFLQGHSCFINELPNLKAWATELLVENNFPLILSENDFIFWMHQGYMFAFFKMDEGHDPPIYFYTEVDKPSKFFKITDTFTEFLARILNDDKTLFQI